MAKYQYFKLQAPQFQLEETPIQPMLQALGYRQKRFDAAYELAGDLEDQYIDALPKDRARADAIQGGWRKEIDDMVKKYDGDYSQMYKDLGGLKRRMTRELTPGGEGYEIGQSKARMKAAYEAGKKQLAGEKITGDMLNNWYRYTMDSYGGVQKDPTTGAWTGIQPEDIGNYVDPYELGLEAVKELVPDTWEYSRTDASGMYFYDKSGKEKYLSQDRIREAVSNRLSSDERYWNMLQQEAKWTGRPMSSVMNRFQTDVTAFDPFAYSQTESGSGMRADSAAIYADKKAMLENWRPDSRPIQPATPAFNNAMNMPDFGYTTETEGYDPELTAEYFGHGIKQKGTADDQLKAYYEKLEGPFKSAFYKTMRGAKATEQRAAYERGDMSQEDYYGFVQTKWKQIADRVGNYNNTLYKYPNEYKNDDLDNWAAMAQNAQ